MSQKRRGKKKEVRAVKKLLLPIALVALATVLAVLFWPTGTEPNGAAGASLHTEVIPADPLVEVVPVGEVEPSDIKLVTDALAHAFKLRTRSGSPMVLPEPAYDEARKQYNADWVLRVAGALKESSAFRTVLVSAADIYSGETPYIFSLSYPWRKLSLVSTTRLGSQGRIEEPLDKVRERLKKLAIRAFAASLGLEGCESDCVLAGRPCLATLDRVPYYFCPHCALELSSKLKSEIGSPHGHFQAALMYLQAGSPDGAISEFKKAIELKSDYFAAYLNLGEVYSNVGYQAEAIATYRKAAAVAPTSPEPRLRLGRELLLSNQPRLALEELHAALALQRDLREAHRLLGITYQCFLSDPERARAHYRKFRELGGDPEAIKELLDDIEQARKKEMRK